MASSCSCSDISNQRSLSLWSFSCSCVDRSWNGILLHQGGTLGWLVTTTALDRSESLLLAVPFNAYFRMSDVGNGRLSDLVVASVPPVANEHFVAQDTRHVFRRMLSGRGWREEVLLLQTCNEGSRIDGLLLDL